MPRRRPAPPLHVLAEGEGWLVVAKPPGLLVHRAEQLPFAEAALQVVRDQVGRHVYPIHRLDRQASGCLLFATDKELAGPLSAAMSAPEAQKTYLAFVRGYFKFDEPVVVDRPMKDDNGILKEASSTVAGLGRSHDPRCSLLRVEPRTGRYHQVRRHVRDLMHPVIGDTDHGDSKINRYWREEHGNMRLGLHAVALRMPMPDGTLLDVTCPLFADHARLWSTLPWWDDACAALPALTLPPMPMRYRRPTAPNAAPYRAPRTAIPVFEPAEADLPDADHAAEPDETAAEPDLGDVASTPEE